MIFLSILSSLFNYFMQSKESSDEKEYADARDKRKDEEKGGEGKIKAYKNK